jgi:hypothetical protein
MRLRLLLALALLDYAIYRGLVWLYESTEATLLDDSLLAEVAFATGGLVVLLVAPVCGWRMSRARAAADELPRARALE